jgi:hypothetical protein
MFMTTGRDTKGWIHSRLFQIFIVQHRAVWFDDHLIYIEIRISSNLKCHPINLLQYTLSVVPRSRRLRSACLTWPGNVTFVFSVSLMHNCVAGTLSVSICIFALAQNKICLSWLTNKVTLSREVYFMASC